MNKIIRKHCSSVSIFILTIILLALSTMSKAADAALHCKFICKATCNSNQICDYKITPYNKAKYWQITAYNGARINLIDNDDDWDVLDVQVTVMNPGKQSTVTVHTGKALGLAPKVREGCELLNSYPNYVFTAKTSGIACVYENPQMSGG